MDKFNSIALYPHRYLDILAVVGADRHTVQISSKVTHETLVH